MNHRTRRVALAGIAAIAVLASADALAHSYTGLYGWALHHRLSGWQAVSWPAEIDAFLLVGNSPSTSPTWTAGPDGSAPGRGSPQLSGSW